MFNFLLEDIKMPSFDIVSELQMNEVQNAVDNANREVSCRFDFKGIDASFSFTEKDKEIKLGAESDFQEPEQSGKRFNEVVKLKSGLDQAMAKKVVKTIKDSKLKVTTQIQGEMVRVTGKKRDDLQLVIDLIRKSNLGQPFQFNNFRD